MSLTRSAVRWSVAVALSMASGTPLAAQPLPSVLVVFSLRSTAPGPSDMEPAFRKALDTADSLPIDLQVEYIDLTDRSDAAYEAQLVALLREKYASRRFDVVIADRPESLRFVAAHHDALFNGAPIVFADVVPATLATITVPQETTGILLEVGDLRTVDAALQLQPDARRIVVVGGASKVDRDNEGLVQSLVQRANAKVEVVSLMGQSIGQQLQALAALTPDSIVLFMSYRADNEGRSVVGTNMLRLVVEASGAPVYGTAQAWLGEGIVGGDLVRHDQLALQVADLAKRIINGEAASSIPIVAETPIELMFDWRQLRRWGLDESRLPAGSAVLFREETFFERYRWYVLGFLAVAVAQAMLIGGLLVERRTRRLAEAVTRDAEQRYRTVADFNFDWEDWQRPDGTFAYVSPSCHRVTGHHAQAFYDRPALLDELVVPDDRERWRQHSLTARSGGAPTGLEFRITTTRGEVRWIEHVCTPVSEHGQFLGVRASNRDITERKHREDELRKAFDDIGRLREQLEVDNTYLHEEQRLKGDIEGIVGTSNALRYVIGKARQVAETSSTVLLMGETGVGKDMVAAAIHHLSPRRARPLVRVNCAALPPTLIESELFGHEKGAFTGANAQRKGRFEIAHGTTLFLDEVGELPLDLQAKLLRVLQDGEFERVGGNATIKADVRVISATNRQLLTEVKQGRFREDLWYRLSVFPITLPPLRERREDIPLLVGHFIEKHCRRMGRAPLEVTKATLRNLQAREWVGNIRELESVVERAVITSHGGTLQLTDDAPVAAGTPVDSDLPEGHQGTLEQVERHYIVATLERAGWRVDGDGGAASLLGMNPSTLRSRMGKLDIRRPGRPSSAVN